MRWMARYFVEQAAFGHLGELDTVVWLPACQSGVAQVVGTCGRGMQQAVAVDGPVRGRRGASERLRSDRPCDRAPDPAPVAGDGGSYVRVQQAWTDNAATGLGLLAAAV